MSMTWSNAERFWQQRCLAQQLNDELLKLAVQRGAFTVHDEIVFEGPGAFEKAQQLLDDFQRLFPKVYEHEITMRNIVTIDATIGDKWKSGVKQ